ncbi:cohesin domain-containing protein [Bacteroidota bacterium]
MIKYITYGFFALLVILCSCESMPDEPKYDNPLDPENPNYTAPHASITNPLSNGLIIDTNFIVLSWTGSFINSEFSFRLSNTNDWSTWSILKTIQYNCLTDGNYAFYIKEKYPSGDEQVGESTISFTIDNIFGPGVILEQQCIEAELGDTFEVYISLEEVESVLGVFISISFDPEIIVLIEREALSGVISSSLGDVVFIATEVRDANDDGLIEMNMARFGGDAGSSEEKQIGRLKFRANSIGNTDIILNSNSALREDDNDVIEILKLVNASVTIQ